MIYIDLESFLYSSFHSVTSKNLMKWIEMKCLIYKCFNITRINENQDPLMNDILIK